MPPSIGRPAPRVSVRPRGMRILACRRSRSRSANCTDCVALRSRRILSAWAMFEATLLLGSDGSASIGGNNTGAPLNTALR
jgi:hypothetical protein